ncbi:MAG: response regulator, partial [Actinomycetota bacterium]
MTAGDGASGTVLVAEDDRAVRDSLVRALTLEGYRVTATTNGAEALDAIAAVAPDVLLL